MGRRGGKTCPLWPSFRRLCGKHEGESLQHKKGIDGSGGELLGYRLKRLRCQAQQAGLLQTDLNPAPLVTSVPP